MADKNSRRDIVERLRDPMVDLGYDDRLLIAEELERLRAALRKIGYGPEIVDAIEIARAAIGEQG